MAIGPQKILEKRSRSALALEKYLDEKLSDDDNHHFPITISVPSGYDFKIINQVLAKYHTAGWRRAEMVSDQRDGDYFCFDI